LRSLEFDPETTALAGSGFDAHFPAHALGGAADNREAEAAAFVTAGVAQALKHLEQVVLFAFGDANAVVFDPDAQEKAARFGTQHDLWRSIRHDVLNGIAEEICQALL